MDGRHGFEAGSQAQWRTARAAPPPFDAIIQQVVEEDRHFFAAHPGTNAYDRPYVPGEAWPDASPSETVVRAVRVDQEQQVRIFAPTQPA